MESQQEKDKIVNAIARQEYNQAVAAGEITKKTTPEEGAQILVTRLTKLAEQYKQRRDFQAAQRATIATQKKEKRTMSKKSYEVLCREALAQGLKKSEAIEKVTASNPDEYAEFLDRAQTENIQIFN